MGTYKICVYAICKNESAFVDRWMDSMEEADQVIVTDTGSDDDTVARLRQRGALVFEELVAPFRFDIARNLSLGHVPLDADICVCTDLDELLEPGWRQKLEEAWQPDATMGNYLFNWSLNPDGTPNTQFIYFKVHGRQDYIWKYPAHECLVRASAGPEKKVFIPGMVLNHYPDPAKSRSSYLGLLEMGAAEMPRDPRMSYYLGREYMYAERWQDCIRELERYLGLPAATWADERSGAMRWIAKCQDRLGRKDRAAIWYLRAIAEQPGMRDAYVEYAWMAFYQNDWPTTYYMIHRALAITAKSGSFINAGYAWDHGPYCLGAVACHRLGMAEQAKAWAGEALTRNPGEWWAQMLRPIA